MNIINGTPMDKQRFLLFITWNLPLTKTVNISEFCNVIENNLKLSVPNLNEFRHLSWWFKYDYKKLLDRLTEDQLSVVIYYFTY